MFLYATSTSSGSDTLAITPDLGPSAALSATTSGMTTTFDASASVPDTSPIVSYSWNFGDSDTDVTSTASVDHTYATNGNYTASVTETDAAGASTTEDYTRSNRQPRRECGRRGVGVGGDSNRRL